MKNSMEHYFETFLPCAKKRVETGLRVQHQHLLGLIEKFWIFHHLAAKSDWYFREFVETCGLQFGQNFGALIRREREDRGLSQKDVLDLVAEIYPDARLTTSHLSNIETGKHLNTRAKTINILKTALDLTDAEIEACRPTLEPSDINNIIKISATLSPEAAPAIAEQVAKRSGLRRSTYEQLNEALASVDSLERALVAIGETSESGISKVDALVAEAQKSALLADTTGALRMLEKANSMLSKAGASFEERRAFVKNAQANLHLSQGQFAEAAKHFEAAAALFALKDDDLAADKRHEFACTMYRDTRSKGTDAAKHALSLFEANRPYCAAHIERKHWATGEIDRASCLVEIACRSTASCSVTYLNEAIHNLLQVIEDQHFETMSFEVRGFAANSLGLALLELSYRQNETEAMQSTLQAYEVFNKFRPMYCGMPFEADFLVHTARSCQKVATIEPLFATERLKEAESLILESLTLAKNSSDELSYGFAELEHLSLIGEVLIHIGNGLNDATREKYLRAGQNSINACQNYFDLKLKPIDYGRFRSYSAKFYMGCATASDPIRNDAFLHRAEGAISSALSAFEISYSPIDWARAKYNLGSVSSALSRGSASKSDQYIKSAAHFRDAKEIFEKMGCSIEANLASFRLNKIKSLI